VALSQIEKAKLNTAIAKAEEQAVARARVENNIYREGAQFESNIVGGVPKANLRLEYEQALAPRHSVWKFDCENAS